MKANGEVGAVPRLSVVMPAYNEATRLPDNLKRLHAYLEGRQSSYEVIVVDDGSTDDTAQVVTELSAHWPDLRLVRAVHRGKGGAIREGVLEACGDYIMVVDADFSMPVEELARFSPDVLGDFDITIGSREAEGAQRIGEPAYRHVMGRVFNRLVQVLLIPGFRDTQCGFKCMRREVAHELCAQQTIEGWGFDPELLVVARRRGYAIREVPITWRHMPGSKIHPLRDTLSMLADVMTIRVNLARGRYEKTATAPVPVPAGRRANDH